MIEKNFFEHQLRRTQPSSWLRKSLLFEISNSISFHGRELNLVPKGREMNELSCVKKKKKKKMGVSLEKNGKNTM